jgi:hypothetical protein
MSAPPVRFVLSDPVPKDFWSWHKEFEKTEADEFAQVLLAG